MDGVARACARPGPRAALVLGLAFALYAGTGSSGTNLSSDTAVYATIGREMVESGDWTRLTVDGEPYGNKPPLVFWMEAVSFEVLGFTEKAARLPSRLFGLATIALLLALVRRAHGRRAAFFAGLCAVTWPVFQRSASTARLDTALTFFTLASVGWFLRMDRRGPTAGRAAVLGAILGLAVLAKGPAGLIAAGAIALGAPVAGRGRTALRAAPAAAAALLVVAGPWYALQVAREGGGFLARLGEDLGRSNAPSSSLGAALSLYATDVFLLALPWLPAVAGGAVAAWRRTRRRPDRALAGALVLGAIATLLVGIATRGVHYSRYFVPAVPFFAWLAGPCAARGCRAWARPAAARRLHVLLAATLGVVVLVGYPTAILAGLFPARDRYAEVRRAVEVLEETSPGARALPTWKQVEGGDVALEQRKSIGSLRAAVHFFFGKSLVAFDAADPTQPPLVLLRHLDPSTGAAERLEFERRHGFAPVFRGREYSLYRTR